MRQWISDDREQETFRVNRQAFLDEQLFHSEKESIFEKCWLYIGHESEITNKGDFQTRKVLGRPLIFCRDSDGEVRVLFNTCPHRGALVCREREGNAKTFVCFYHGWSFNNKGDLVGVPGEDAYGKGFCKKEMGLYQAPRLESYKGFYFINFKHDAESLYDYLAGTKEYIDLVVDQSPSGEMEILKGTQEYNIKANWKLLIENSFDGYHLLSTHQTYIEYIRDNDAAIKKANKTEIYGAGGGRAIDLGNGHAVIEGRTNRGRPVAHWMNMYGEESKQEMQDIRAELDQRLGVDRADRVSETNRNLFIFPNLIINDGSSVTVRQFFPDGPASLKTRAWALGVKGETETSRERRLHGFLSFYGPGSFATPDDVAALEMAQNGYETWREVQWNDISRGMNKGEDQPQSANDEFQMRVFWRKWHDFVAKEAITVE